MLVSKTRYKPLWVALGMEPVMLHASIARIAVLYEDLRIELLGAEKSLPELEAIGENYRRNYFVRRSIATLLEFSGALTILDDCPEWAAVKTKLPEESTDSWMTAMAYFKEHHEYLKQLRNDFGGHFGLAAAKWATENLSKDAVGSIEIYRKPLEHKAGPRMHFASEFVSTAMCRHKQDKSYVDHFRHMYRVAVDGYSHSTNCVHVIMVAYLYDRFR